MRIFMTGAAGWIGSRLTRELVAAGHEVVGLVRSEPSALKVQEAGGTPVLGDVSDHDVVVAQADKADAMAHLAFTVDFTQLEATIDNEVRLVDRVAERYAGSGRALVVASGTPTNLGRLALETDRHDPGGPAGARGRTEQAVLATVQRGVRSAVVRMPRTVHGRGDRNGLMAVLVALDRQLGTAAYVGDGQHRWPAVHVRDAARLFHLTLEAAPAGSVVHAVGEEGVRLRDVADVVARLTGLPAEAVGAARLGPLGALLGVDQPASSSATRALLGWQPTGPTLLHDLEAGYYTE